MVACEGLESAPTDLAEGNETIACEPIGCDTTLRPMMKLDGGSALNLSVVIPQARRERGKRKLPLKGVAQRVLVLKFLCLSRTVVIT